MAYTSGLFSSEGYVLQDLTAEQVRFGVILRLPFRIRVAGLVRIPPADNEAEVWIRNDIAVPPGSHLPAILHALPRRKRDGYAALWTEALVILNSPALPAATVEELRQGESRRLGQDGNLFRALSVINETIFGYAEASGSILGGAPMRFLTDMEFLDSLRLVFAFAAPSDYTFVHSDIGEILDWRPVRQVYDLGQLTGEIEDLPASILDSIPEHITKFREHAYHELAFKAKMAMIAREPMVALVLACAALEGAHAAFLRRILAGPLSARAKGAERLVENLLREQGIHTMIEITSYVFMDASEKPTADELDRCLTAIELRNAIVHAKQKKGAYKLRQNTFMDLTNAYSAVMAVFNRYTAALSQPLNNELGNLG